jgi:GNAT superfamily N-acetyltransferase
MKNNTLKLVKEPNNINITKYEIPIEQRILKLFMVLLCQYINIPINELCTCTSVISYHVTYEGKLFEDEGYRDNLVITNDRFELLLIPVSENMVELFKINVFDRGKGTGTKLMNHILDVSDELGITVKLIPINFLGESKNNFRLRNWYESFGFKKKGFMKRPEMYYTPEIEFKQAA